MTNEELLKAIDILIDLDKRPRTVKRNRIRLHFEMLVVNYHGKRTKN